MKRIFPISAVLVSLAHYVFAFDQGRNLLEPH